MGLPLQPGAGPHLPSQPLPLEGLYPSGLAQQELGVEMGRERVRIFAMHGCFTWFPYLQGGETLMLLSICLPQPSTAGSYLPLPL